MQARHPLSRGHGSHGHRRCRCPTCRPCLAAQLALLRSPPGLPHPPTRRYPVATAAEPCLRVVCKASWARARGPTTQEEEGWGGPEGEGGIDGRAASFGRGWTGEKAPAPPEPMEGARRESLPAASPEGARGLGLKPPAPAPAPMAPSKSSRSLGAPSGRADFSACGGGPLVLISPEDFIISTGPSCACAPPAVPPAVPPAAPPAAALGSTETPEAAGSTA